MLNETGDWQSKLLEIVVSDTMKIEGIKDILVNKWHYLYCSNQKRSNFEFFLSTVLSSILFCS